MAEMVKVRVRDCACPGTPHNGEGDWVLLAPALSLEGGLTAEQDLVSVNAQHTDDVERSNAIQRQWILTFIRYGAKGWNLLDESGEQVPFSTDALLADYPLARPVADEAADLYTESVLRPFLTRLATRSPTGPTSATTSARRRRTSARRGQSSQGTSAGSVQSTP